MDAQAIPEMEVFLKALGSGTRLRVALALQQPARLGDIRIESDGRPLSRQAIQKHVRVLERVGVVARTDAMYVVRHARMFALVESLRELAKLRAAAPPDEETQPLSAMPVPPRPRVAHLVTVHGVREGAALELGRPAPADGWVLGRSGDLLIDHDPFVSGAHARIVPEGRGHALVDIPGNRNGTLLNWCRMEKGAVAPLSTGDVIGVGLTRLVYRSALAH